MAYNDYTGSTKASVALLTNIKGMLSELYTTYVAEIEAARDGESSLSDKFTAVEATITSVTTEVENARDGEANLLAQIDDLQSLISTVTTEVENARDGETALIDKINDIDTAIAALAAGSGVVISSGDTTAGYVEDKILGGTNITVTKGNAGGNETATINGAEFGTTAGTACEGNDSRLHVLVRIPTPSSPLTDATGVSLTPDLAADAYGHVYGTTRDYRQFQIETSAGDWSTPVYDANEDANAHTVTSTLSTLTEYKWRCRDVSTDAETSEWSAVQTFTTADIYIATPTNTDPTDTETDIGETPTLTSSAFSCVNGSDTHASSDWEIYDGATLIYSSYDDTSNKTTLTVPAGNLSENTTYTWRVRHTGTTYGDSEWSTSTSFTTKAAFALIYGIAQVSTGGGAGTWARVDANGDNITLTSTDFDNHPVWGGIEAATIDSQAMIKIPKFWYKVGDAPVGSDRAGKKCWWISDTEVSGFSVHPAFMDSEVEIDQFWIGAYEGSDDGGTKLASASGVAPLASTSFDDFVTKINARNTGGVTGFHMPDIYEVAAIQMLMLIEMGTPDAQSAIDVGNDSGSVHNTGVDADVWRGIYQFWSNVYMWVDGLRTTIAETIKIYDNVGNQTWVVVDTGLSANRSGYPVTMKEDTGTGYDLTALFIGDTFDGTDTNGTYADYQAINKPSSEDFVCRHGGYWDGNANYGLFYIYVNYTSSNTNTFLGGRLAKR